MSKTFVLILNIVVLILGMVISWLTYQKAITPNPDITFFATRALFIGLAIGVLNLIIKLINHFAPKPQPARVEKTGGAKPHFLASVPLGRTPGTIGEIFLEVRH